MDTASIQLNDKQFAELKSILRRSNPPEFLDVPELAETFCLSSSTVYKLVEEGKLPALKVGGSVRFHLPTVRDWLQRHRRTA